jgi:hypothetical protein
LSLLNRFFADKTPPPQVRDDATFGHPGSRMIQMHARKGDWMKVRDAFAVESDPNLRARYMELCADAEGAEQWVEQWLDRDPDNGDAWLMAGALSIKKGWDIRGSAKADEVPKERWDPFHEHLMNAEEELERAADLKPDDPVPLHKLLGTGMALGAPIEERMSRIAEGRRRDASYHGVAYAAVHALAKKWGGSHELMFRVARDAAASAPPGSAIPAALANAHVERWLYIDRWEEDREKSRAYFEDRVVKKEIVETHRATLQVPKSAEPWVANTYAFCFFNFDKKTAKREFIRAGGYFGGPFMYIGIDAYRLAMQRAWKE